MLKTMRCCFCKEEIKSNPRLKFNQHYCHKKECQRARKRVWQHEKMENDEGYRQKQAGYIKLWRKGKPFYQYMIEYRKNHPEYVKKNRKRQKQLNERRKETKGSKIVKMDTLVIDPLKTKTYEMIQYSKDRTGKIVKMDTLMVQLKQIQGLSIPDPTF